jgi:hypothetical protein
LRLNLIGGNANSNFEPLDELPGKTNYLLGNSPSGWRVNIPNYQKVAERGVYRGIDVVYYGNPHTLEYDFTIAPGADPNAIDLAFQGADDLHVERGDLVMTVAGTKVAMREPVAYQDSHGDRDSVPVSYMITDKGEVRFLVGEYDRGKPLIIDPTLAYSTYVGGSNIDGANAIAVASDGTAFIAGGTFSLDFPTAHPLQPNHGGPDDFSRDAFVSKISADGSTLLYSTYLGGKNEDVANGIAVDSVGNAYVTGTTLSPDFPVTAGSFNTECGGDGRCGASFNSGGLIVSNAFVTKLNVAGSGLIYSSFLGEYENVRGQAIAVDANQIAYVTGQTEANGVPTVPIAPPAAPPPPFFISATAFQTAYGGGATDAFVAKISVTGSSILYASYLGGNNEDTGYGIAVDGNATAYVTGLTYSTNFPIAGTPLQAVFGGAGDAFVSKVNTTSSGVASLVYSTYLGGSGLDQGNGIAVDNAGNAYVSGGTASSSFVFTPNGFQTTNHGQSDAFVAKLTPAGALSYFTFLGGSNADSAAGVAVDSNGNAFITGSTVSTDFPTTSAVFQSMYGGGNADAFVSELGPAGTILVYSSFLGGTNTDLGTGITVDASGAYVTGQTCSQDFPLVNPSQAAYGGNCDAFVSKVSAQGGLAISPAGLAFAAQTLGTMSSPQSVTVTNNGNVAVTFSHIVVTGNFAQTNTCSAPLQPAATCSISVTFTASSVGSSSGTVTLTYNGPGSPQVVRLSGTGTAQNPDFMLTAPVSTATTIAGQSASYSLVITPVAGFSQSINLSCSGLPANATCSISPDPVTPAGTSPTTITVTVATGLRVMLAPRSHRVGPFTKIGALGEPWLALVVFLFMLLVAPTIRRRPATALTAAVLFIALTLVACGGQSGVPVGTPAGTFPITVNATSGALTHSTTLTLLVN